MQIGNAFYRSEKNLPEVIPVFPLPTALLLPNNELPLNIFEPRYIELLDHILAGNRLIGIIQPVFNIDHEEESKPPKLCDVGSLGRLTSYSEAGDGRYLVSITGICRFRVKKEISQKHSFRQLHILPFLRDLETDETVHDIDRAALLASLRAFLEANNLEADWKNIEQADTAKLVNFLSMMSPYGPAEKQALLEAADLKTRADTLIAITEFSLARDGAQKMQLQ